MGTYRRHVGELDASGMRVALVAGRFNEFVTSPLLDGARRALRERGADDDDVTEVWVPGAFEMPLVAQRLASSGEVDAVVCLGAVIRGDTPHFDFVAGQCAEGLTRVALDTGIPVIFGVVTTNTVEQAEERSRPDDTNKGFEAALTAVEMVTLLRSIGKRLD
jgi:6,7-dimethyl-8-ribityllumazine synthase